MENHEWQEIVEALVDAKRALATAWQVLDGTDGAAPGVEHVLRAALTGIDAIYAIEYVNGHSEDLPALMEVEDFWDNHASLPGFAVGS